VGTSLARPKPTTDDAVRGLALRSALQAKTRRELQEFYSFWDGHGRAPDTPDGLIGELSRRMSSEKAVRKRVRFLSKKLLDLLKFFLRSEGYRAGQDLLGRSRSFSYLSPFELKAAVNALCKRGFLFHAPSGNGKPLEDTWLVPCELGDILQTFVWDDDRTIEETVTLEGHLGCVCEPADLGAFVGAAVGRELPRPDAAAAVTALREPEAVAARLSALDEKVRATVTTVAERYGGIVSCATLEKNHRELGRVGRKKLQEQLETNLLGTVRQLSLGEYGIHQFDEVVVVFDELVDPIVGSAPPPIASRLETVRSLGVDLISDISAFLSYIDHNPIKLTLSGKVYRTAVRKLEDSFIVEKTAGFTGQWLFQYLFDFCQSQSMIERGDDRSVVLTIKGRAWDRMPLEKKLTRLLRFSTGNWSHVVEPFHGPRLIELYLEALRDLPLDAWVDVNAPAFAARNRYLANLDRFGVRDAFQSRYQFTQQSGMRDPQQLAAALTQWARERLFLFGMLDMGEIDGKAAAIRLTPLGARALGKDVTREQIEARAPLVVNPDFEVILFPDGDTYDLITELDRFAERTSSDSAYHYRLTSGSIERAVAEGLEASTILRVLSENSRVEVPQNVIYSIRRWSEKVKFVTVEQVCLLRGRNKEVIDRILHDPRLRPHVVERLSATAVLVSRATDRDELASLLEPLGVFLADLEG